MGGFPIVLDVPPFDLASRIAERNEEVPIESFFAQPRIKLSMSA
jgi:hypothetical protein